MCILNHKKHSQNLKFTCIAHKRPTPISINLPIHQWTKTHILKIGKNILNPKKGRIFFYLDLKSSNGNIGAFGADFIERISWNSRISPHLNQPNKRETESTKKQWFLVWAILSRTQELDPLGRSSKPRNKNLSSEEFKDPAPKATQNQKNNGYLFIFLDFIVLN